MMNEYPFTEQELSEAVDRFFYAYLAALPPERNHTFSPSFKEKMEPLFRRARRREGRRSFLRSVAAVLIMLLFTATVWLSVDAEARGKVLEWVREAYEYGIVYRFDTAASPTDKLPEYEITWLPEGFEMVEEIQTDTMYSAFFFNETSGKSLIIDCQLLVGYIDSHVIYDEGTQSEIVKINDLDGEYFFDNESNCLIWIDAKKNILFSINSDLEKNTIIRTAEGIKLK